MIEIGYFKANIILSNIMDPNHLKCAYTILRWTDTGRGIMAAILFLITQLNVQKWFKMYQMCAFNNYPAHFGRISASGGEIFENSN